MTKLINSFFNSSTVNKLTFGRPIVCLFSPLTPFKDDSSLYVPLIRPSWCMIVYMNNRHVNAESSAHPHHSGQILVINNQKMGMFDKLWFTSDWWSSSFHNLLNPRHMSLYPGLLSDTLPISRNRDCLAKLPLYNASMPLQSGLCLAP